MKTSELMQEFRKYVDDCILLTQLAENTTEAERKASGTGLESENRPLSFDEWYARIWQPANSR